ncbi:MAG: hypothetical protein LBT09_00650 [Planctomycetaceae bacterium]|nr:hypothetical protein [Planctomycetaceae bacterium]
MEVPNLAVLPELNTLPTEPDNVAQILDNEYGTDFVENGNKKIRYAIKLNVDGRTMATKHKGAEKKIYAVTISKLAYDAGHKRKDLLAIADHEIRHVEQFTQMRQADNEWEILNKNLSLTELNLFMEANAYLMNLNSDECWLKSSRVIPIFKYQFYDKADLVYIFRNVTTRPAYSSSSMSSETEKTMKAMRVILQSTYSKIPFIEMKDKNYYEHVRSPKPIEP